MNTLTPEGLKDFLANWSYLFTYGYTLDIYAYGRLRLGIDRLIGEKIISYIV